MRRSRAKAGWRGFQRRVREAIQRRYGSVYALEKAGVIPKPPIRGWLKKTQSRLPFTPALLTFARETNASLNHLLLGEGPPLRGQVAMKRRALTEQEVVQAGIRLPCERQQRRRERES